MEDAEPAFSSKVKPGDIIIAGKNFGCGNSREHAPIAIKAAGVSCVITKTFARIFFRNSFSIGLPIFESPEAAEHICEGDRVAVDADTGVITNLTTGKNIPGNPRAALHAGDYRGRGTCQLRSRKDEEINAQDTLEYTTPEIDRITRMAFNLARKRRKKVTSVDKANVLESSRLWREVVTAAGQEYPDVELEHMYVDNCAMQLVKNPGQFDVLVTENMFGDILSDQASMLTGSLGMLASASIGGNIGLFEPSHGSAPKYTGMQRANPIATILSGAMLLRFSLNLEEDADSIERAVTRVLDLGYRTADLMEEGKGLVNTIQMGDRIVEQIEAGV